jgi:hypothetical protein
VKIVDGLGGLGASAHSLISWCSYAYVLLLVAAYGLMAVRPGGATSQRRAILIIVAMSLPFWLASPFFLLSSIRHGLPGRGSLGVYAVVIVSVLMLKIASERSSKSE